MYAVSYTHLDVYKRQILGVVLNKVDRKKNGGYYNKNYGKYYGDAKHAPTDSRRK